MALPLSKRCALWLLCLAISSLLAIAAEPRMSWLENEAVKVGVDLDLGGAITWLSTARGEENVINSFDWGRQVQMSFYSGPVPFAVGDKKPAPNWAGLGWNPIQVGDCFGHRARILDSRNDGREIYVKCVPMQWPLEKVEGDCTFESWLSLRGPSVVVRGRLRNLRADKTQYTARAQELPAVYTNGPYYRIVTYSGAHPFSAEPVQERTPQPPPQWDAWLATEHWCALVNKDGWGLGVWNPHAVRFGGGFNAKPGTGGPKDNPCGYLAPQSVEILDHDIVYDFTYELMLGTVAEIRAEAARKPRAEQPPRWDFRNTRAGWHYLNAQDAGWPPRGALAVRWEGEDPQLVSPWFFWERKARTVVVEAAAAQGGAAELFWATLAAPGFSPERRVAFPLGGDGQTREYRVPLPEVEGLVQLRLDPPGGGAGSLRVQRIWVE